jgi:hypothetical protein
MAQPPFSTLLVTWAPPCGPGLTLVRWPPLRFQLLVTSKGHMAEGYKLHMPIPYPFGLRPMVMHLVSGLARPIGVNPDTSMLKLLYIGYYALSHKIEGLSNNYPTHADRLEYGYMSMVVCTFWGLGLGPYPYSARLNHIANLNIYGNI